MTLAQVQHTSGTGSGDTVTATFGSTPTEGNIIVVSAGSDTTIPTPSGFTLAVSAVNLVGHYQWWKVAGASESTTVTINPDGNVNSVLEISEYSSDAGGEWLVDVTASTTTQTSSSTQATGTTAATAQNEELAIPAVTVGHTGGLSDASSWSWTNSFTHDDDPTANTTSIRIDAGAGHKFLSATGTQTSTASWSTISSDRGSGSMAVFKNAEPDPWSVVGVSAFAEGTSTTCTLTYPAGIEDGDIAFALIAGGGDSVTTAVSSTPSDWTIRGSELWYDYGAGGAYQGVWYRNCTGSESGNVQWSFTTETGTGGGIWGAMIVFRAENGFDEASPFDFASPVQESNPGANTTYQPVGDGSASSGQVTVGTDGALLISFATSSDNNALGLASGSEQSFTLSSIAGTGYDSTQGSDGSLGVAYRIIDTAGVITLPTWEQTANGADNWNFQTIAVKPAGSGTTLTGTPITATPTLPTGSLAVGVDLTGQAVSATPSLPTGSLAIGVPLTGTVVTVTPTLPTGSVGVGVALTGSVVTATPTLPTGSLAVGVDLAGAAVTLTPTLPTGSLAVGVELAGTVVTATPTLPTGSVATVTSLTGTVVTATPTLPTGSLAVGVDLAGAAITITPTLPTGSLAVGVNLAGAAVTITPTLPTGTVNTGTVLTGSVVTATPTLPTGSLAVGVVLTGATVTLSPTLPTGSIDVGAGAATIELGFIPI